MSEVQKTPAEFHPITGADWQRAIVRGRERRARVLVVVCPDCGAVVRATEVQRVVEGFAQCPRCAVGSRLEAWRVARGQNLNGVLNLCET
jgi:predicted RNA-binding Zn-ribbon protein involved in translation (DUF1610 family)